MIGPLLVRADGGAAIGAGHVMRCLALAQGWQDAGGEVTLVTTTMDDVLRERLSQERINVVDVDAETGSDRDADATARHAAELGAGWVVADSYDIGSAYQRRIRDAGLKLLVLDDDGRAERYHADLVLNVNLGADDALYADRNPASRLLLGARYALLRREFTRHRDCDRTVPTVAERLLVTFGGGDPHGLAAMTIRAIHRVDDPDLATTVIAATEALKAQLDPLAAAGPQRITVLGHVGDMATLMLRSDLAVAAAGGTSWERALLKLPTLVVSVAENQRPNAEALHRAGAATHLGWWREMDEAKLADAIRDAATDASLRRRQADSAGRIVDGRGAERVVQAIVSHASRMD